MRPIVLVLGVAVTLTGCSRAPLELTVASFNIRYGTAPDGDNDWTRRRPRVTDRLRTLDADVIGLQEALRFQLDQIGRALPEYAEFGVGRRDGDTTGEYAAILYRPSRLRLEEGGTFWFSDTPSRPGSVSWGNTITRICTWARFTHDATGHSFYVYNVHLDHESQPSRERSVALLVERIAARRPPHPVVVVGDFNAGEANSAVLTLRDAGFSDTFRVVDSASQWVGTFNGFRGDSTGPKIDYVFASAAWRVLEAAIVRDRPAGRDASDHFPVTARLSLK